MDDIDFDPRKNAANARKHGIDFPTAARIWDGMTVEHEDERRDYGETRFIALGTIDGDVFAIVYTWRGDRRRLISARKGNSDEREIYRSAQASLPTRDQD